MTYATVTKTNCTYQPRTNIVTLIESNITTLKVYSVFPNLKKIGFNGFPFIVIPEIGMENEGYLGDRAYNFMSEVEGTIYHDRDKLGDNQLRNAKQTMTELFTSRTNQKTLRGYGIDNVKIEFDQSPEDPIVEHEKEILPVAFTISFNLDLVM